MHDTPFLIDADPHLLLHATALNHVEWMTRCAVAQRGAAYQAGGATFIYSPVPLGEITIPFPSLTADDAGERIEVALDFGRENRPIRQLSVWTLDSGQPPDLGARLVARGFGWGWQPHWMALDLAGETSDIRPPGIEIGQFDRPFDRGSGVEDYRYELTLKRPQEVWHLAARRAGRVVGDITLNLTVGSHGVAGIYSMFVLPAERRRGVGTALLRAACAEARDLGCRYAVLNSAFDPFYVALGFASLGHGQTWWMREGNLSDETLRFPRPSRIEIDFVEAIGRGDVAALDALQPRLPPISPDAPILGRVMTPMELAREMNQQDSVAWLVRHGAAEAGG